MTTLRYPITAENGSLLLTREEERKIPEVIRHCLQTRLEERPMRPDWGIEDPEFNVVYDLPAYLRTVETALIEALGEYPGTSLSVVGAINDSGTLPVTVYWQWQELEGTEEYLLT